MRRRMQKTAIEWKSNISSTKKQTTILLDVGANIIIVIVIIIKGKSGRISSVVKFID
jgi:hypothetical protein